MLTAPPTCVPPDLPPLRALELMRQFGIGALPVVSDGQLVGILDRATSSTSPAGCCSRSSPDRLGLQLPLE